MVTDKPKRLKGSGWRKISNPEDLEKCIVTMLNKILMAVDPVAHAGRFASLANAWTNTRRLRLDSEEIKKLKEAINYLEEQGRL
jgi:hypothetical protein